MTLRTTLQNALLVPAILAGGAGLASVKAEEATTPKAEVFTTEEVKQPEIDATKDNCYDTALVVGASIGACVLFGFGLGCGIKQPR